MHLEHQSHGFTALGPMHQAFAKLTGLAALAIAMLLGAFAALAFAPFHLSVALLVSFTGLIWMIDGARGHRRWGRAIFGRGWAFGFGYFLVSMYWTAEPFLVEPEKHLVFIWMPLLLLPGGMALIWGAACAMAGTFWSQSPSRVFVFPVFMTFAELVRGHLFGGFPWNLAGTTWIPGGPLSQAASIGGVYWLTLVTIFVMGSIAAFVDLRDDNSMVNRVVPAVLSVVIVSAGWGWGAQRLQTPLELTEQNIIMMDSGVPQAEKWEIGANEIFGQYVELMESVETVPGDLIIWPEAALPVDLLQSPGSTEAVVSLLRDRKLILGTRRYTTYQYETPTYYNSLTVLDTNSARSTPLAVYDKHRLVPFGELAPVNFIPFGRSISGILPSSMQRQLRQGFEPGELGPSAVYVDGLPPFVALICYEGLFPAIPRAVDPRAEWMVLISNDAWFGEGLGPDQHAAQNRYRTIESGLPMVRVASRGQSGIIDGLGRLTVQALPVTTTREGWEPALGRGALPASRPPTLYYRYGLLAFWLTALSMLVLAFLNWRR
ncbi:MAG: apolipoprotein N-acyltransferase [Pseudomonadota bacterium]